MEELQKAIEKQKADLNEKEGFPSTEYPDFQKAAEDWAVSCLRHHRDGLLNKGLKISEAMVNYLSEMEP